MNTPSALQHDEASGLAFRSCGSEAPEALLFLLHGVGGNETQLSELVNPEGRRLAIVWPRAPLRLGPSSFGWFEVRFTAQGPAFRFEQAEASRLQLAQLVESLQAQLGIPPTRTVLAGFSQGGILSAGLALTRPRLVAGFGLLSGRILPELTGQEGPREDLECLSAFLSHGREDATLPLAWAERSEARLEELGVPHLLRLYSAGHELTPEMVRDFRAWVDVTLP